MADVEDWRVFMSREDKVKSCQHIMGKLGGTSLTHFYYSSTNPQSFALHYFLTIRFVLTFAQITTEQYRKSPWKRKLVYLNIGPISAQPRVGNIWRRLQKYLQRWAVLSLVYVYIPNQLRRFRCVESAGPCSKIPNNWKPVSCKVIKCCSNYLSLSSAVDAHQFEQQCQQGPTSYREARNR